MSATSPTPTPTSDQKYDDVMYSQQQFINLGKQTALKQQREETYNSNKTNINKLITDKYQDSTKYNKKYFETTLIPKSSLTRHHARYVYGFVNMELEETTRLLEVEKETNEFNCQLLDSLQEEVAEYEEEKEKQEKTIIKYKLLFWLMFSLLCMGCSYIIYTNYVYPLLNNIYNQYNEYYSYYTNLSTKDMLYDMMVYKDESTVFTRFLSVFSFVCVLYVLHYIL